MPEIDHVPRMPVNVTRVLSRSSPFLQLSNEPEQCVMIGCKTLAMFYDERVHKSSCWQVGWVRPGLGVSQHLHSPLALVPERLADVTKIKFTINILIFMGALEK
jgi:hypothetical protein